MDHVAPLRALLLLVNVTVYTSRSVPSGREVVVIENGSRTANWYARVATGALAIPPWTLLTPMMLKENVPGTAGMPLINPVEEPRVNPPGNVPEEIDHKTGPVDPLTVSAWLYEIPAVALGRVGGLMVTGLNNCRS
jgi:hypothetical protein